jgi:hypothetical protein
MWPVMMPASAQDTQSGSERSAFQLNEDAETAYRRGLYNLAVTNFYEVYKKHPRDPLAPSALHRMAEGLVKLNKPADACTVLRELRVNFGATSKNEAFERQLNCSGTPRMPPVAVATAAPKAPAAAPAKASATTRRPLGPSQLAIDAGMTDLEFTRALCAGTQDLPVPTRNAAEVRAKIKAAACQEVAAYEAASKPKPANWEARIGAAFAQAYVRAPANTFSAGLGFTTANGNVAIQNIVGIASHSYTYNVRNATCRPAAKKVNCSFEASTTQQVTMLAMSLGSYTSKWNKMTVTFDEVGGALRSALIDQRMAAIAADHARNSSGSGTSPSGPTRGDRCRADAMTMMDWGASGSAAAKSMFCGL